MDRRTFLKLGGIGTLATLSGLLGNSFGSSRPLPNILFILVDSLNDWVSALGRHPNGFTPNIDRLAERGMLFTNAHSVGTISNGARTALFTGLHPTTTGIYNGNVDYRSFYPDLLTLSQYFMRLRYQVRGSGSLLHAPDRYSWQAERYIPTDKELITRQLSDVNFGPNFDWGALDVSETEMHDYKLAEWACDYIRNTERTFFLGVGFNSTRPPWYLPRAEYRRFSASSIELPNDKMGILPPEARHIIENNYRHQAVLNNGQWAEAVSAYVAAMLFVDDMVGKVIDTLDESEHGNSTIVVLTSPHGLHLGSKGYWLYDTLWEDLSHVPLIMNIPTSDSDNNDYLNAGTRIDSAVSLLDIYPTLLDLIGSPPLHALDGRSLVPLIENPALEWDHPVLIARRQNELAMRSNRWRYIQYATGGEELYEYLGDPDELINQAANSGRETLLQDFRAMLPTETQAPRTAIGE